jgi:hypothetical protein
MIWCFVIYFPSLPHGWDRNDIPKRRIIPAILRLVITHKSYIKKKLVDQSEPNYVATKRRSASKLPVDWTGTVRHAPTCRRTHTRSPRAGSGTGWKKKIVPPPARAELQGKKKGTKAESVVDKMAAGRSAINTTNHCLTISSTTDKGKNICNIR